MKVNDYFRLNRELRMTSNDIKDSLELTYEQTEIIYYLYSNNGEPISLMEICRHLDISRSYASKSIKLLIGLDYLEKYRNINDERIIYVRMNDNHLENVYTMLELIEEQIKDISLNEREA